MNGNRSRTTALRLPPLSLSSTLLDVTPITSLDARVWLPGSEVPSQGEFARVFDEWLDAHLEPEWITPPHSPEAWLDVRTKFGRLLGNAGWLSVTWPRSLGGLGLPVDYRVLVVQALGRRGAPEPMNQNALGIFAPTVLKFGTKEQCERLLLPMAGHEEQWCQGFSEPEAGSDLAGLRTRATPVDGGYRVSGQKVWTSFAAISDRCYALVRTDTAAPKHQGISLMALDLRAPGVTVRPLRNMTGAEEFSEVFFDDVFVPEDDLIGDPGAGWAMATYALRQERTLALAQRSMQMSHDVDALVDLWGSAPAERRAGLVHDMVDVWVRSRAVDAVVARAIVCDPDDGQAGALASIGKLSWSEAHQELVATARRCSGPLAAVRIPPHDAWMDKALAARAVTIYGGTSQIQRELIARSMGLGSR